MTRLSLSLIAVSLSSLTVRVASAQKMPTSGNDSLPSRVYCWDSLTSTIEDSRTTKEIMEGSTTSLSHFEVHATTLQPGKAPHPPHTHADEEELIIVKEGQITVTINGISHQLGRGSIAFAIPGEEHGIVNTGKEQATYYVLKYKSRLPMDLPRAKQNGGSFMINWDTVKVSKTDKGQRREIFNRPTSQLAKFEMHTTALNAGLDSHAPHNHKEEEIILILRGNVTMHIGDNFYKAAPGDLVFLPSMVTHNLINTGNVQCEYFAFQWRN